MKTNGNTVNKYNYRLCKIEKRTNYIHLIIMRFFIEKEGVDGKKVQRHLQIEGIRAYIETTNLVSKLEHISIMQFPLSIMFG